MTTHDLRSWPDYFEPIFDGKKSFELRLNDRNFQVGDLLRLREYNDRNGTYTGREVTKRVTYILQGVGSGGIPPLAGLYRDYVVLSLADAP